MPFLLVWKEGCPRMPGVKGSVLKDLKMMPFVASADSVRMTSRHTSMREKRVALTTSPIAPKEMTQWMQAAARKIMPKPGDQHRLSFSF
jgi:hypothetical protein